MLLSDTNILLIMFHGVASNYGDSTQLSIKGILLIEISITLIRPSSKLKYIYPRVLILNWHQMDIFLGSKIPITGCVTNKLLNLNLSQDPAHQAHINPMYKRIKYHEEQMIISQTDRFFWLGCLGDCT